MQGSDAEFRFFTEFQSHEPEFDYLKSLEIEEKINQIKWLPRRNAAHFLLTTNDKTIKLWKVSNKPIYVDASECARVVWVVIPRPPPPGKKAPQNRSWLNP